ncbi:hypothetical protein AOLI_G00219590 [Acnodon oligacanthus]
MLTQDSVQFRYEIVLEHKHRSVCPGALSLSPLSWHQPRESSTAPHLDEGHRDSPFTPASPVSKHMAAEHLERVQELAGSTRSRVRSKPQAEGVDNTPPTAVSTHQSLKDVSTYCPPAGH